MKKYFLSRNLLAGFFILAGFSLYASDHKIGDFLDIQTNEGNIKISPNLNPFLKKITIPKIPSINVHKSAPSKPVEVVPSDNAGTSSSITPDTGAVKTDSKQKAETESNNAQPDQSAPPSGQDISPGSGGPQSSANQVLPPSRENSSGDSSPTATQPYVAPSSATKVTITPLTEIFSACKEIEDDLGCSESFCVSRDGKHYATVKRLGLTEWTVVIDGVQGPVFNQMPGKENSGDSSYEPAMFSNEDGDGCKMTSVYRGNLRDICPNDDFSSVLFTTTDQQSQPILVIQKADGSAKQYPILKDDYKNDTHPWTIDIKSTYASQRLVRIHNFPDTSAQNLNHFSNREIQIDDGGKVLGPFIVNNNDSDLIVRFDSSKKHYLLASFLPVLKQGKSRQYKSQQPTLYLDGIQIFQEQMQQMNVYNPPSILIPGQEIGSYFARFVLSGNVKKEIVNGKLLATIQDHIDANPVVSHDWQHIAHVHFIDESTHMTGIYLDNGLRTTIPAGATVEKLQFNGDSKTLVFTVNSSPRSSVFVQGKEVSSVANGRIDKLWAGPQAGQYAALAFNLSGRTMDLFLNGQKLPFGGKIGNQTFSVTPEVLWFTKDGRHVFGYGRGDIGGLSYSFIDNVFTPIGKLASRQIPILIDQRHWMMKVDSLSKAYDKDKGGQRSTPGRFYTVNVELPEL
jgi:hypothetical protein